MSDNPHAPCRPSWCLEDAREFLETHIQPWGLSSSCASTEELLANLLDTAYLRGRREERGLERDEGATQAQAQPRRARQEETEVELDATRTELEALREPFLQLMKRLRLVDGGDDPESPISWVQGRIRLDLWQQLRNLYEATLPPVDHSWLEEVNKEEEPDIRGTLFDVEPKKKEQP